MTQLTQQEIEMIEREATELSEHNAHAQRDAWMVYDTCKITATKYLTQLKEERERSAKLLEALQELVKWCKPDGRWNYMAALENAELLITEYKNNNQ